MESSELTQITLPVQGMDCVECTQHVKHALEELPGVQSATVLLAAEKAILFADATVTREMAIHAVKQSGYDVPEKGPESSNEGVAISRLFLPAFLLAGLILFLTVIGEWLGWFEQITTRLPVWVYLTLLIVGGFPVFRNVSQALFQRQITSHTLMSVGVLAAALIGEWPTAVIIVLFMRIGDWVERQTTQGARKAIHALVENAPTIANIEREGEEVEIPVNQLRVGDILICRPGYTVAADGQVLAGNASVDTSSVTGESVPVDLGEGATVYAGSVVIDGGFRLSAERVGAETTIGRVIALVEQAEANKGQVQTFADRFSSYYLPIVLAIAAMTYIVRQDVLAAVSVLVVVCSCAIALATPIAMLASIGAAGKRGLVIKGGRYLEILPKVDIILLDKTGTLTLGIPEVTAVIPFSDKSEKELVAFAAGVEKYSEHPLGKAVRRFAAQDGIQTPESSNFRSFPGQGAEALINGQKIQVGNGKFVKHAQNKATSDLEQGGQSLIYIGSEGDLIGVITLADQLRKDVPQALDALRKQGITDIHLLTGDHKEAAAPIAEALGVEYQAGLLPEDKINIVKQYQEKGKIVAMIGDGINDAPALAQADVGIAMGTAGVDVAMQAADIALLGDDFASIPALFSLSRRTMGVVRLNLIFTAIYNLIGLSLASFGLIPPALAAAAQSLPDVGILVNSSRLLRFNPGGDSSDQRA